MGGAGANLAYLTLRVDLFSKAPFLYDKIIFNNYHEIKLIVTRKAMKIYLLLNFIYSQAN